MRDIKEQLTGLERLEMPDRWERIARSSPTQRVEPGRTTPRRRVLTIVLAAVVGVVPLVVLWLAFSGPAHDRTTGPGNSHAGAQLVGEWIVMSVHTEGGGSVIAVSPGDDRGGIVEIPGLEGAGYPALSPDGTMLAFVRAGGEDVRGLYVSTSFGEEQRRIVPSTANNAFEPTWSPDGSRILFVNNRVGHGELFTVDPDGSDLVQVTQNDDGQDYSPSWSPDGSRIAFGRNSGGPTDLYVVNADGSGLERLTNFGISGNDAGVGGASWSLDGSTILFTKSVGPVGDAAVFSLDVSSLEVRSIGITVPQGSRVLWSPQGDGEVAYVSAGDTPSLVFTSIGSDSQDALILGARTVFGAPSWGGWASTGSPTQSSAVEHLSTYTDPLVGPPTAHPTGS